MPDDELAQRPWTFRRFYSGECLADLCDFGLMLRQPSIQSVGQIAVASGPPKQVSGKCFFSPFEIAGDAFDHQLFESIRWLQPRSGRGERFRSERRAKVVEERRRLCYVPTRRGGEVDQDRKSTRLNSSH